jgi:mRNA-degrading endonuclease toxin of MazEF toxin-antitoxin module
MNRGDIVLATIPHSSGAPPKIRPVLVIQADYYNRRITNVLLATITSNLARMNDPAHFLIDLSTPEGKQSGLQQDSLISCLNLAVLPKKDIGRKIGHLPMPLMRQIDACLRAAMDIH